MYALLLYDHLILSEQEGADLCSKVRKSRGVRGITTDEKEKNISRTDAYKIRRKNIWEN